MKDPERLLDASSETPLGRDLRALGGDAPVYDVSAGLERFRELLGAVPPDGGGGAESARPSTPATSAPTASAPTSATVGSGALGSASSGAGALGSGVLWFGGVVVGLAGAAVALGGVSWPRDGADSAPKRGVEASSLLVRASEDAAALPRSDAGEEPAKAPGFEPPSKLDAATPVPALKPKKPERSASPERVEDSPGDRPTLAQELEELRRLRGLVAHAPERVLVEVKAPTGASGAFSPERDALVVEALVRLGRADEARAKAKSFFRRYPQHPEGAKLRRLVPEAP